MLLRPLVHSSPLVICSCLLKIIFHLSFHGSSFPGLPLMSEYSFLVSLLSYLLLTLNCCYSPKFLPQFSYFPVISYWLNNSIPLLFQLELICGPLWNWLHACSVLSKACDPMDWSLPGPFSPWDFPGKNTGMGLLFPSPEDLPDPEIKTASPESPALGTDPLPLSHWGSSPKTVYSNPNT